jgi:hypothetical protein
MPPAAFPRRYHFPQTEDMRPPAECAAVYRPLREIVAYTRVSISSCFDRGADYSPNNARPLGLYRPAWEEIIALVAPSWGPGAALELTSPPNIVLPGKSHRLPCEISRPCLIVLPGKRYRLCEETLSSCPGTYIVLPGKSYRPLREPIPSPPGKVIVLLGK